MSKTVVLLLSVLLSGISFSTAAVTTSATTAACDALLANPISDELIAEVVKVLHAHVDFRQLVGARVGITNEHAEYLAEIWRAEDALQAARVGQTGKRETTEVKEARRALEEAKQREEQVRPAVDAEMDKHVDSVILAAAVEVDPYFAKLKANYDGSHYVVEAAKESLKMSEALSVVLPRATLNPWPHIRARLLKQPTAEMKAKLGAAWPEVFRIAREMKFTTAAPEPTALIEFSDYARLTDALTKLRDEATPTRDLLKARLDEFVRSVIGALYTTPPPAPKKRRLRWKIKNNLRPKPAPTETESAG